DVFYQRYDAVFHMVSAAIGAEHAYKNTAFRTQTIEQARANDLSLREAWTGAEYLRIIENTGTFEEKLHHLESAVMEFLGVPVPIERERKFLVERSVLEYVRKNKHHHVLRIEQMYLKTGTSERIRQMSSLSSDGTATAVAH